MTHPVVLAAGAAAATQSIAFWVLAIGSVGAALGMVLARKAVHCAVLLAFVMLTLAIMYAMQGAPFLAFVQVIVYTGAVLMLFLFVLMIVGVTSADSVTETIKGQRLAAGLAGIGLLVLLSLVVGQAVIGPAAPGGPNFGSANVGAIAALIFTKYVFPFEVTSALLITAALGAMVLAHRERTSPKPTQRDLSIRRMASGRPAPLPGPGTYARHNAVDMPAMLPNGTAARQSVSAVIGVRAVSGITIAGPDAPVPVAAGRAQAPAAVAGSAEPGTAEPGTAEPGTAEPGTAEPGTAEPGTAEPGTAGPGPLAEPAASEASSRGEPPAGDVADTGGQAAGGQAADTGGQAAGGQAADTGGQAADTGGQEER